MRVGLVTDSTATLPPDVVAERDIAVVPLQVVIGAAAYDENEAGPQMLAEALRAWTPVSTSRPNPEQVLETYERLAREGAEAIVSVHLSAELSGTYESALLAARQAPVPVHVVDTHQVGMGTGFAVLAAADARDEDEAAESVAAAARKRAEATTSLFYVDTLEYLRRGGRVGAAAALLGSALAVKPILGLEEGRVAPREKVRTAARALARLADLAVAAAEDAPVDVAVAHLAGTDRAADLTGQLSERLGEQLQGRTVHLGEIGPVLGAHVGPGMVAVSVARRA